MKSHKLMKSILAMIAIAVLATIASAQDADTELAKTAQNPIADLISVPLQLNVGFDVGPDNDEQTVLNIQPVYPVNLTEEWNLINRFILPVIDQPAPVDKSGIGDLQYQGYLTPAGSGGLLWGVGPVISFPTASDDLLGSEQWSAGPGIVALKITGPWVFGGLINNVWSFAGEDDRSNVNAMTAQYFINYNFPDFYLSSAPIITANWKADSDDRWTVPIGGGVGKIFRVGKLPLNCQLQAYYNIEHPDNGPEWSARLQVQMLFPK